MVEENNENFGYGDVDEVISQTQRSGKFMTLEFGKTYQVRVVSLPKYTIKHWLDNKPLEHTGDDCQYCGKGVKDKLDKTAQWHWVVIDRDDNAVKVLQAPNSVARNLKDLSEIKDKRTGEPTWGNPQTFDITIKKEKKTNGFTEYTVDPVPNGRGPISEEEKALVLKADIDLAVVVKNGKKSDNMGNYGGKKASLETAPEHEQAELPTTGSEEEEVNPDDIPF